MTGKSRGKPTPDELIALRHRVEELESLDIEHARVELDIIRLTARIAHDINNVMDVILASTNQLSNHLSMEHPSRTDIATIERAVHETMNLTRLLLEFSRDLPSIRQEARLPTDSQVRITPPSSVAHAKRTILLAEDNPQIRDLIITLLRREGFEVIAIADGNAALDAYRQRQDRISLLLLDVNLPGISGLECLRAIRGGGSDVPVILVTGDPTRIGPDELDEHTILLAKPFQMSELERLAADMVAKYRP